MKRNVRTLVSLLLVIVAIVAVAAPALALSSTVKTVESGGTYNHINGFPYQYRCRTSGSTTSASGSMTYGKAWLLGCTLDLFVSYQGEREPKTVINFSSGTDVAVSTNNVITVDNVEVAGVITEVNSTFNLGNHLFIYDTVS